MERIDQRTYKLYCKDHSPYWSKKRGEIHKIQQTRQCRWLCWSFYFSSGDLFVNLSEEHNILTSDNRWMIWNIGLQMLAISEVTGIPVQSCVFCMIYLLWFVKRWASTKAHTRQSWWITVWERALYDFHKSRVAGWEREFL